MGWLLDSQKHHGLKRTVDFIRNHVEALHHLNVVLHTDPCYALGERLARLELGGYGFVAWHVVLEACASDTQ